MRFATFSLLFLLPFLFVGCASPDYLLQGDRYLQSGQPALAVQQFERAATQNPALRGDPSFAAKLNRARGMAAFDRSEELARSGDWQGAMDQLGVAETYLPNDTRVGPTRASLSKRAAVDLHKRALAAADQGDAQSALDVLHQALSFNPSHQPSLQAKAYAEAGTAAQAPAALRTSYEKARGHITQRRWLEAETLLASIVRQEPNLIPARTALAEARGKVRQARELASQGQKALQAKGYAEAADLFRQSLQIWPEVPGAKADLTKAEAQLQAILSAISAAEKARAAGKWDAALVEVKKALQASPTDAQALALQKTIEKEAALAQVKSGDAHLAGGRLAEARAAYQRAQYYVADFASARDGLARALAREAVDAVATDQLGAAWVHYRHTAKWVPAETYAAELAEVEAALLEDIGLTVSFRVMPASGDLGVGATELAELLKEACSQAPPSIKASVADVRDVGKQDDMTVFIELQKLETRQELLRDEERIHEYMDQRLAPNPELPRLQFKITQAQRELERLREEFAKQCLRCEGSAQMPCPTCKGRGTHPCGPCNQTGKIGDKTCRTCKGIGQRTCRQCKEGWRPCHVCRGTGRASKVTERQIQRQERIIENLQLTYDQAPTEVAQPVKAQWPYHLKTMGQVTRVVLSLEGRQPGEAGPVLNAPVPVEHKVVDTVIDNPAPDKGLAEDPLQLPDEAAARTAALKEAADLTVAKVVTTLTERELAFWQRLVKHERNPAARLEAQVRLLFMLRGTDPDAAAKLEAQLISP